jgi:Na+-translocating ferredoxin:NAD+ oxidoreductase RnfG subunit
MNGKDFRIRLIVLLLLCAAMIVILALGYRNRPTVRAAPTPTPTPAPIATPAGPAPQAVERVLQTLIAKGAKVEPRDGFAGKYPIYLAVMGNKIVGAAFAINAAGDNLGLPPILMGLDAEGRILGLAVSGAPASKPGVAKDLAALEAWLPQLASKDNQPRTLANTKWRLKEDRGEIDPPAAGQAIRPRAVLLAVRDGLSWFRAHRGELLSGVVSRPGRAANPAAEAGGAPEPNLPRSKPFPR